MTQIMDAVTILDRRVPRDAELQEMIAEEERKLAIAQLVYDARIEAGLTQKQLAKKIGTHQPTVARLEDAEYGSQSLAMLHKVAKAVGKTVQITLVDAETIQTQAAVKAEESVKASLMPEQTKHNWAAYASSNTVFRLETGFSPKPQPGYKPGGTYSNAA